VQFVRFLPDDKTVLSVGRGGTVRLWEAASGQPLSHFAVHELCWHCNLSPDGKTLVAAPGDALWNVATGKKLARLAHVMGLRCTAFSPDGKTLAVAACPGIEAFYNGRKISSNWSIRLHDAATGKELHNLGANFEDVGTLAYSADGRLLLAWDGGLHLWHLPACKKLGWLEGPTGEVLFLTPNGECFRLSPMEFFGTRSVTEWNRATGRPLDDLPMPPRSLWRASALSPRGTMAAFWTWTRVQYSFALRDLTSGKKLAIQDGQRGDVRCAAFSSDGKNMS
jgi:hypothetical protein